MFRKKKHSSDTTLPPTQILRCSFCNKSQRDVKKLIAGPNVQICDECVDICLDILVEAKKDAAEAATVDGHVETSGHTWPLPGTILLCGLCRMATPFENSLAIPERGVMCAGCVLAFEAALGEHETSP